MRGNVLHDILKEAYIEQKEYVTGELATLLKDKLSNRFKREIKLTEIQLGPVGD